MKSAWLPLMLLFGLLLALPASAATQFFNEHTITGSFIGAVSVFATDVDGDGDVDVLGAADIHNEIAWWKNAPSGNPPPADPIIWTKHTIRGNFGCANEVHAADVDGDDDVDVLGVAYYDNDITWWENDPSGIPAPADPISWTQHTINSDFSGGASVYAADLDGDGDTDVLGGADWPGPVTWWENDASGNPPPAEPITWTQHTISGEFDALSTHATDVDGDGDTDVLGASWILGDIAWWENDPSGNAPPADPITWTHHTINSHFAAARSVYATDVDQDGDVDVLGAANGDDDITWWENDPNGNPPPADPISWTQHTIDGDFGGAWWVYATDVDGDGDVDVLGAANDDYDITWWENKPSGNPSPADPISWTEHLINGDVNGAESVYAIDVDGDGDTDVLGGGYSSAASVRWWENITQKAYVPLVLKNYGL